MNTNRNQIIENIKEYFLVNQPPIIKNIKLLYEKSQCENAKLKLDLNLANREFSYIKQDYNSLRDQGVITSSEYEKIFLKKSINQDDIDKYIDFILFSQINSEMSEHVMNLNSLKNRDTVYYSSYNTDLSASDFYSKNVCWFTPRIDQSILFQLERFRNVQESYPTMFEFRLLHKAINVIHVFEPTNTKVLELFGLDHLMKEPDLFRNFLISMGVSPDSAPDTIAKDNNKFILYFCEAYNRVINLDPQLKKFSHLTNIHGYMNPKDQHEIALTRFNEFVDPDTVTKHKYVKIVKNNVEYSVPFGIDFRKAMESQCVYKNKGVGRSAECAPVSSTNITKSDNLRMSCGNNSNIQIYYKNEETGVTNVFDCANKPEDFYWRKKYLKYKQKYLELKNKLDKRN